MTAKPQYTDEQKQIFVDRAAQIGINPTRKELGYPGTYPTGQRWCQRVGVTVPMSALQTEASRIGHFYDAKEKLTLCQRILDEAWDMLVHGEKTPIEEDRLVLDPQGIVRVVDDFKRVPVRAQSLSQLTSVVQRTIQVMELLEGRVTDRIEQVGTDATDLELSQMIREYRARNDSTIREIRGPGA